VLLVDSCDRGSFGDARKLVRVFRRKARVPFLVAANKQDGAKALPVEAVGEALKVDAGVPVVPCVATEKDKVRAVLERLQGLLAG
jgi:signal recognition particle receptor subunit beta